MKKWEGFTKGVNLGGWISQFAEYDEAHFRSFITEEDFKEIKRLGFDHVRIPVDYVVLENDEGEENPLGYEMLRNAQKWCHTHDLRMIVDVHEVYGYSFDPLKDMDREKFFYDEALQARFYALWSKIAKAFGDDTDTVALELLNEVVLIGVADAWNKVVEKVIDVIRKEAPRSWIVVGGVCYNSITTIKLLDPPKDDRIVYNFHCYEPIIFTHQGAYWVKGMPADFRIAYPESLETYREQSMKYARDLVGALFEEGVTKIGPEYFETLLEPAVKAAEDFGVPLYCGEYGVIELAPMDSTLRWFHEIHEAFDKFGIGRAIWNYRGKDFGLVDEYYEPIREEILK